MKDESLMRETQKTEGKKGWREREVEWVVVVVVAMEDGFNPGAGLSLTNCQ